MINVKSSNVPAYSFLQTGNVNRLFSAVSQSSGGVGSETSEEARGIPCHVIRGVQWVDVDRLIKELGGGINSQDDVMAPTAALDFDNIRSINDHNYISSPALVKRMRMNDRSRVFALTIIRNFLTSATGAGEMRVDERIGEHIVDLYIPRAKLAVDVNSGTLTTSMQKKNYLDRQNIYHIEFRCGAPKSRGASVGSNDDVDRLLHNVIPEMFSIIMARYTVGDYSNSTTVSSHFSGGISDTFKLGSKLKRGGTRFAPYVSRQFN